jgi:hypothetical protein
MAAVVFGTELLDLNKVPDLPVQQREQRIPPHLYLRQEACGWLKDVARIVARLVPCLAIWNCTANRGAVDGVVLSLQCRTY